MIGWCPYCQAGVKILQYNVKPWLVEEVCVRCGKLLARIRVPFKKKSKKVKDEKTKPDTTRGTQGNG